MSALTDSKKENTNKTILINPTVAACEGLLNPSTPVKGSAFQSIEEKLNLLLYATEGLQGIASTMIGIECQNISERHFFAIESLGKHMQDLRNEIARELRPIYESFGVGPMG